jgi:hypothetical protein
MHGAHTTGAAASGARIFDNRTLALTFIAGARDAEKALLKGDLAAAAAFRTGFWRGSRFGAIAAAGFAGAMARNLDLFLRA